MKSGHKHSKQLGIYDSLGRQTYLELSRKTKCGAEEMPWWVKNFASQTWTKV